MSNKLRIAVFFGGKSAEHEVSLLSAKNIVSALSKDKYEVVLIGIDKKGAWHLLNENNWLVNSDNPKTIALNTKSATPVSIQPGWGDSSLIDSTTQKSLGHIDAVFPILHGPFGEDGTIQGIFKSVGIPFVGPGVLGSAIGMDKDVMKRLLRDAEIPIGKFLTFQHYQQESINFEDIEKELGNPIFVKPANMGSSVGISRATDETSFNKAIKEAFLYDTKIIIEESIIGREIECSVLGNETPKASIAGEIVPKKDFYSYDAKYIDDDGAGLEMPAKISDEVLIEVQKLAIKTFKVLCCEGLSRVDFFLTKENKLLVNEITTLPGFTKISMYPKLWDISGISYSELLDNLINLAIQRFKRDSKIKVSA